jgi:hypothetical protein
MNGKNALSLNIFKISNGIQPTGDVFLIMNEIVNKLVKTIVLKSN